MTPSFEQRRDEIHEGIIRGNIGCPFAREGAANGMIEYCRIPRRIDPEHIPSGYVKAMSAFTASKIGSVLIGLPDEDSPVTEQACTEYAHQLFPETVSSMQFATVEGLYELFAREQDPDPELYELLEMNPHAHRYGIFDFWRKNNGLLHETPAGGSAAAYLLRQSTESYEPMFTFTMDPTYAPVGSLPHPRWSPHFGLVMNYRSDLQGLRTTAPKQYEATKAWMQAAIGYDYVQGFRIGQTPDRSDRTRQTWKPQD